MKKIATMTACALSALVCLGGGSALAQMPAPAQTPPMQAQQPPLNAQTQQFSFPSRDGSASPASTLRITEQPATPPAPVVRDTQESVAHYQRCRNNADREAVDRAQLQALVQACLNELQQRRQP